jgi:hypothetical protein
MMLFYNRTAAEELKRWGVGVLRRHAGPDVERLEAMRRLDLPASVSDRLAMRAGSYCLATEEDTVHWGLGVAVYCHASSPIRRWADCLNQMALAAALGGGGAESTPSQAVAALNAAARRAKGYERDLRYVRVLLGADAAEAHEGVVVEPSRQSRDGMAFAEPGQQSRDGMAFAEPGQQSRDGMAFAEPGQQSRDGMAFAEPGQQSRDGMAFAEPGRVWVPYLDRLVRADTGECQAGESVHVRFFCDASKRNWKGRLVVRVAAVACPPKIEEPACG